MEENFPQPKKHWQLQVPVALKISVIQSTKPFNAPSSEEHFTHQQSGLPEAWLIKAPTLAHSLRRSSELVFLIQMIIASSKILPVFKVTKQRWL